MGIRVFRDRGGSQDYVGKIEFEASAFATFEYDPDYLARAVPAGELGISEQLVLDASIYTAEEIAPYFRGLLPEGEVYARLAEFYQKPQSDFLSILEQIGCESIGSLTFLSDGIDPREYEPRYKQVTPDIVSQIIENPVKMATLAASSTRLSLAGAQSKVAWYLPQEKDPASSIAEDWFVPCGTAPSTHVIKLSRKGEEEIALNELACSLIAESAGIETAKVARFSDLPGVISVERYDRLFSPVHGAERVVRLHQEDFCQALGLSPYYKYQPEGSSANYPAMAVDLIKSASSNPQADSLEFAKRLFFCFAIGNSDSHLKNFSLLYNPGWTARRLAPLYDVTCIPLTGYSTSMPFEFGNHRRMEEVDERDLLLVASDLNVGIDTLDQGVREVVDAFDSPSLEISDAEVKSVVERIFENAKPRVDVLKRYLGI